MKAQFRPEITKVVVEHPGSVIVEMTHAEASTLLRVTEGVGGSPRGPRGHVNAFRDALQEAGVRASTAPFDHKLGASIYFKD